MKRWSRAPRSSRTPWGAAPGAIRSGPRAASPSTAAINPWRDSLLRRMLAIADIATALVVAGSLALFPGGTLVDALWAAVFAPVWILLAKLSGLYDRDQRSLRHLTVDELPGDLRLDAHRDGGDDVLPDAHPGRLAGHPGRAAELGRSRSSSPSGCAASRAGSGGGSSRASGRSSSGRGRSRTRPGASSSSSPTSTWRSSTRWTSSIRRPGLDVDRIIVASQSIDEALLADLLEFCRDERIKLSVVPPARGMFGTAVRLEPRRRPLGRRVHDLGRLALDALPEARARPRRRLGRAAPLPAGLPRRRRRDPDRDARARDLHAASGRDGRASVQDAEVPHDGRGRGGEAAAARPVRQPARPDVQAAERSPRHPRRDGCCAGGASTSCRSSSTSSAGA